MKRGIAIYHRKFHEVLNIFKMILTITDIPRRLRNNSKNPEKFQGILKEVE